MTKKYNYCVLYSKKIDRFLYNNAIKYKIIGGETTPRLISFTINENQYTDLKLERFLHSNPIITNVFTKTELLNAGFLTIRPVGNVVDIVNTDEAFIFNCPRQSLFGDERYGHREQIGNCKIKRIDYKKETAFYSSSTGFSELFTKTEVYDLLMKNSITGVMSRPVILENTGKDSGLCQLYSNNLIHTNSIFIDKTIKVKKCPVCGAPKFVCRQDYQLAIIGNQNDFQYDFYMTDSLFGDGIPEPLFLVSNKFYRMLVDHNLTRNVKFEPVVFTG